MKKETLAAVSFLALALAAGQVAWADTTDTQKTDTTDAQKPDCHVNVDTDDGKGGTQVKQCDSTVTVGAGGPIKDVDFAHPAGKGDAFVPKAGRDAQSVVSHAGHTIEDGAHWLGKWTGIHL